MRRDPLKGPGLAAATGLAAVLVAACTGWPFSPGEGHATPGPVSVEVGTAEGADHRFVPALVSVPAGAEVRLVFHNRSTASHNLSFTGPLEPIRTRTIMEPGEQEVVEFVAPAPGSYPFVCTVHEGMSGELRVLAGGRDPEPRPQTG